MFKFAKPFFLLCETPLHAGSGTDLGIVDLPIQRERHTGFPKIESSGLKGAVRQVFEDRIKQYGNKKVLLKDKQVSQLEEIFPKVNNVEDYEEAVSLVFGPSNSGEHSGALGFTDARLLLFPVKSMKGIYAWITCPKIIERFINDMKLCKGVEPGFEIPQANSVPKGSNLLLKENKVVLEEYTFEIEHVDDEVCTDFADWASQNLLPQSSEYQYWNDKMKHDIVVLSNDDFRDFVQLSTEVITRIKIDDETGTVQKGALFTEEYLPAESILYSLALFSPIFNQNKGIFQQDVKAEEDLVSQFFQKGTPGVIQLGGNASIGKGIVRLHTLEVDV